MRDKFFINTPEGKQILKSSGAPDSCPQCHHGIEAEQLLGLLRGTTHFGPIDAVYRCPRDQCQALFFARYTRTGSTVDFFVLRGVWPSAPEKVTWPKEVAEISPRFVEIYDSAMAASRYNLEDLVGMGLRKALEFLIKDFAIATHPNDADSIRRLSLSQVITNYCDGKIKATASRAAWLGNDESHYARIWVDQDVKDLKILTRLTVNWIESEILTGHYQAKMPDKKPPASS